MLRIGLTGGIGSGKSTVAHAFQSLGIEVIDADKIALQLTQENTIFFKKIVDHFGQAVLQSDGTLNRKKLRQMIFNHPNERKWLEKLLHPAIRKTMKDLTEKVNSSYCLLVIPLLTESSNMNFLDRICVVLTAEEQQIKRVMQRDQITETEARKILASQPTDEERITIADDIIRNDNDRKHVKEQVLELHKKYLGDHSQ